MKPKSDENRVEAGRGRQVGGSIDSIVRSRTILSMVEVINAIVKYRQPRNVCELRTTLRCITLN